MQVYRIAKTDYINDLSGTGAKLYGGRWNEKGTALLYCAENVSLAILEILVHFDGLTVPSDLSLLTLTIPDEEVNIVSTITFNRIKKLENAEFEFKKTGQKWIESKKNLALKVPSIITEQEYNIIINPNHSKFKLVKKKKVAPFDLDQRLLR